MHHRTDIVPAPLERGGIAQHFAGALGHVQLGAITVVKRDAVKRAIGIEAVGHRPLIVFAQFQMADAGAVAE